MDSNFDRTNQMKASNQYLTLMFFVIDFQTFDQQNTMHPKLFQVPFRGGVGLCLRKTILNKLFSPIGGMFCLALQF